MQTTSGLVQNNTTAADEPASRLLAFSWMAGLVAFFFATYAFSSWISILRHDVPSIVFGWEHQIPFVPWMIVPYWSTDPTYVLSAFLFRTRAELATHCKRLLAVQVISVTVFLLFPLKFSFGRPAVSGIFGWMFAIRTGIDPQFNEAPSLHIGLTVVLWAAYGRYFRGGARWLMGGWFVLTMLSTLTTYRHHFFDLPTGLWVGLFCLAMFPDGEPATRCAPPKDALRLRFAAWYLMGAMACAAAAYYVGGAGWLILWGAGALAVLAIRSLTGRPALVNKSGGFAPEMIVLLAPYLGAVWLGSWIRHLLNRTGRRRAGFTSGIAGFPYNGLRSEIPSVEDLNGRAG